MNPGDVLKNLGLEEKEIAVYLALLELGEAAVLAIAKKSGVKRPTAYVVLASLETKGFVSKVMKGKKVFFAPAHPKKILTETEIRLKEVAGAVPQLEAMMQNTNNRPKVFIYEGKSALDRAYDDMFLVQGDTVFMSNGELIQEVLARTLQKLDYTLFSPKFTTKELLDDSDASRAYAKRISGPYRQARIMPKQFSPFVTDIGIWGNIVLITSAKKEYFTVKIESEEIANAFRTLFGLAWQASSESDATARQQTSRREQF